MKYHFHEEQVIEWQQLNTQIKTKFPLPQSPIHDEQIQDKKNLKQENKLKKSLNTTIIHSNQKPS